ncbi:hypothetical protein [Thalassiella azotivora]
MAAQDEARNENPEVEALQAVVDRVVSWQDGATEETVRAELAKGADEAGVEVDGGVLDELARRIHSDPDRIEVAQVVNAHRGEVHPD